jgi:hypothetical protein
MGHSPPVRNSPDRRTRRTASVASCGISRWTSDSLRRIIAGIPAALSMFKPHSYARFAITLLLLAAVAVVAVAPGASAARTCQAIDSEQPSAGPIACDNPGKSCCCAMREEAASCPCRQPEPPSHTPPERESGRSSLTWAPAVSAALAVEADLLLAAPPFGSPPGHQFVSPLAGSLHSRLCVWQN